MKLFFLILILALAALALAVSPAITSFNSGEVSPYMLRRFNFQKYDSSLQTLENCLIRVEGPVERRPGTKFISTTYSSGQYGYGEYGSGIYGQ